MQMLQREKTSLHRDWQMFFFSTENLFLSLLRQSYADYLLLDMYPIKDGSTSQEQ